MQTKVHQSHALIKIWRTEAGQRPFSWCFLGCSLLVSSLRWCGASSKTVLQSSLGFVVVEKQFRQCFLILGFSWGWWILEFNGSTESLLISLLPGCSRGTNPPGGSVLQCSRNYSWRSSLNLVLLFVYERNPCVKSFSAWNSYSSFCFLPRTLTPRPTVISSYRKHKY